MAFSAPAKLDSQVGFSLVELLVVVVVIAIVAAIALLQQGSANEQFQRQNASRQLKVAFERARFDSVKRRAQPPVGGADDPRARVVVNSDSYVLWTDADADGLPEDGEKVTMPLPTGVIYARYDGGSLPVTLTFNMRGEVVESVREFRICNATCTSPTNATSDVLLVTSTGTVNLLPGGAPTPSFNNPSVTTVSNSNSINPDVILP